MRTWLKATLFIVGLTLSHAKPQFNPLQIVPMLEAAKNGVSTLVALSKLLPKGNHSSDTGQHGNPLLTLAKMIPKPHGSDSGGDSGGGGGGGGALSSLLGLASGGGGGGGSKTGGSGSSAADNPIAALLGINKSPLMNFFKDKSGVHAA